MFDDKMRIEDRFETIKEFACLSPQDKELVLEEYRKGEHPFQIEYRIWAIIIPTLLFGAAKFVFQEKIILTNLEQIELFLIGLIIIYFLSRFIVFNLIAPKVLKKIIFNMHKNKKTSNKRLHKDARETAARL
jgi:hypothetical protein